jgi:hydroxymethylpyrimidine/phosphomethylpyrimidine kinase
MKKQENENQKFVLSIAGFDPCAGAGILADIKTFEQTGVYGLGVCSGITFQNDKIFNGVNWTHLNDMFAQLQLLISRYTFTHIKIGIIEDLQVLNQLFDYILSKIQDAKIIWDPVFSATAGYDFIHGAETKFIRFICKKVFLVTPNIPEIKKMMNTEDAYAAAELLSQSCHVFLKGGHEENEVSKDILYMDGKEYAFEKIRIERGEKHGSGCVLSSAITAFLAKGNSLYESCEMAKEYVHSFLSSTGHLLGNHNGISVPQRF